MSKSQAAVRNALTRVLATYTMSSVAGVLGARVDGAALSLRSLKGMYFKLPNDGLMGLIAWRLAC